MPKPEREPPSMSTPAKYEGKEGAYWLNQARRLSASGEHDQAGAMYELALEWASTNDPFEHDRDAEFSKAVLSAYVNFLDNRGLRAESVKFYRTLVAEWDEAYSLLVDLAKASGVYDEMIADLGFEMFPKLIETLAHSVSDDNPKLQSSIRNLAGLHLVSMSSVVDRIGLIAKRLDLKNAQNDILRNQVDSLIARAEGHASAFNEKTFADNDQLDSMLSQLADEQLFQLRKLLR
jgi:tetratricopeptide (TPR) repeat protein